MGALFQWSSLLMKAVNCEYKDSVIFMWGISEDRQ
jgi:hypothetical protein